MLRCNTNLPVTCCRQFQAGDTTNVMLAFEVPGGWKDMKTSVATTVLQFLLGGGGSFSSGGPGMSPAMRACHVIWSYCPSHELFPSGL